MIKDLLLKDEYYLEQLTLFLRNSYGVEEQQLVWVDILRQINDVEDDIMEQLGSNIDGVISLDIDYINSLDENVSEIMDKIGNLLGIKRNLTISCTTNVMYQSNLYVFDREPITLNNLEFFIYIACTIFNNNYNGTFDMANQLYSKLNVDGDKNAIRIVMLNDINASGHCIVYFDDESPYGYVANDSDATFLNRKNLYALFFSGLLTLSSMGIIYTHSVLAISHANSHLWSGYLNGIFQDNAIWGFAKWQSGEALVAIEEE